MTSHAEHYRERRRCLQVLNLSESASEAEIKVSYKSLARQWHPDKNSAAEATEKMQEITAAYNYLLKGHSVLEDDDDDDDLMSAYMHLFPWLFSHFYRGSSSGYRFFFSSDPFGYEDSSDEDDYVYARYTSQPTPRGHTAHRANQYSARNSDRRGSPHAREQWKTSEPKTSEPKTSDTGLAGDKAARRREKKLKQKQRKKEEKAAAQAERAADRHTWQKARSGDTSRESTPASVPDRTDQDVAGSNLASDHASTVPATNGSQVPASQQSRTMQQAQSEEKKVTKEMPPQTAKDEKSANSGTSASNHYTAQAAPTRKTKQQLKEEQRRREEEMAQIAKELQEKMEREREKKAKKQAAKEERERQEAEERRRQEEEEIQAEARRIREIEQRREEEMMRKQQEEDDKRQLARLLEDFDSGLYIDPSGDFVTTDTAGVGNIKRPPATYTAAGYQGFGDDDESAAYQDLGDHQYQAYGGRGSGHRFPSSPRGFGRPVAEGLRHPPPQQFFPDHPPPHMWNAPAASMGHRPPASHNVRGGFQGSGVLAGRGRGSERGSSDAGHAAIHAESKRGDFAQQPPGYGSHGEGKRGDFAQQPPGYGQAGTEHIVPSQVRDAPRFPNDSAIRQSEFIVHNSQFTAQGNNSYQPSSAVPQNRAVPPPHFGQGFPPSPPRPLLQPQVLLGRQPPPAAFLSMPAAAFVPVQPLFNTFLPLNPSISAPHLGPTLAPGLTIPRGPTLPPGLAPPRSPTLPPGLAPPRSPTLPPGLAQPHSTLTSGLVPPPSAVPLPNFSMSAAEHRLHAHRPPPLAPAFNAAHTAAASQARPSVNTHTATASQARPSDSTHTATTSQARPSVSTHTATASQARPSDSTHTATASQARPSDSTHTATASQARPSDRIKAVTSDQERPSDNIKTVAAGQAVPSDSAKSLAGNVAGHGDSTRSINQPRPNGNVQTVTTDQAKRASVSRDQAHSGSGEQTQRASGTGEQAPRVNDAGDEAGRSRGDKVVRGSSMMTNGTTAPPRPVPPLLTPTVPPRPVPPLLTPTGPRPQRPYIPPFSSSPSKAPVPSRPSHLPPKPSTNNASLAASAVGPHGSEKLAAMARVGDKLATGSVGSADSSNIHSRQPKVASVATNRPQVHLTDSGSSTHSSSVFGLDDID